MKILFVLAATALTIITIAITTVVVALVSWGLSSFLPMSAFQCGVLFLGSGFLMFYVKSHRGKGSVPLFVPE